MTSPAAEAESLVQGVQEGNRLALARLLSLVEDEHPDGERALAALFPQTGRAHVVGVTGAPGTGKSSLVNELAKVIRRGGSDASRSQTSPPSVGIVAVDPSSPFTGGALLGDRIRMRDLAGDEGVFVRSMASRGSLGGLARTTAGVIEVLDAAGFGLILVETVGAGQAEVEIARHAHTTIVVEAPGWGDEVQAIKAGVLEIADLLVVNKADLPGAEAAARVLRSMLALAPQPNRTDHSGQEEPWSPPIIQTIATTGEGVAELATQVARHGQYLRRSGQWAIRERERVSAQLEARLKEALARRWRAAQPEGAFEEAVQRVVARQISPGEAVEWLLRS